ncbi:MAG TPA: DUF177 domain-containing protein [Pyrinomonadaceae bacterium]|jgi:uncharacterized protein
MQIDIEPLPETGRPFAHTYAPAELSLEDERARLRGDVRVAGHARRKGRRVQVAGTVETEVEVNCDRCLAPVNVPLRAEFDVSYEPAEAAEADEHAELHDEDLAASVYEGDRLDVDELVREQIMLALPARSLCREACRGLCPTCGQDLNAQACACEQKEIDPRWAGLAAIKSSDE